MKDLTLIEVTRMYIQAGIITQYKHGYIFYQSENDTDLATMKRNILNQLGR